MHLIEHSFERIKQMDAEVAIAGTWKQELSVVLEQFGDLFGMGDIHMARSQCIHMITHNTRTAIIEPNY